MESPKNKEIRKIKDIVNDFLFFQIDTKNSLSYAKPSNYAIKKYYDIMSQRKNSSDEKVKKYLYKFLPGIETKSIYNISNNLLKRHFKDEDIKKINIEKHIEQLIKGTQKGGLFLIDKQNLISIASIIFYLYKKLSSFKIRSEERFLQVIHDLASFHVNPLKDYNHYVKNNPDFNKGRTQFWRERRKSYACSPEFLFLRHFLESYKKVYINIDGLQKEFSDYLYIFLTNIELVLPSMEEIILDLRINEYISKSMNKFQKEIQKFDNNKWKDFEEFSSSEEKKQKNNNLVDKLYIFPQRKYSFSSDKVHDYFYPVDIEKENQYFCYTNLGKVQSKGKPKKYIREGNSFALFKKDTSHYFQMILLIPFICSEIINHIIGFTLLFSDSYKKEMEEIIGKELFFLENFYCEKWNTKKLSLFLNCLIDELGTELLPFINSFNKLEQLQINFFCTEDYYSQVGLYQQLENLYPNTEDELKRKKLPLELSSLLKNNTTDELYTNHNLCNFFEVIFGENIFHIFYYILKNETLKEITFEGDIPLIINLNDNFCNALRKLFVNVLLILNSNKKKWNTFRFFFPKLEIDSVSFPGIIDVLDDLDLEKRNKCLENLCIQLRFCNLPNIHKLLSTNLVSLTIGDLDDCLAKSFIDSLCNYDFTLKSKLTILTLGIQPHVKKYSVIKGTLLKLFSVHMRYLKTIKLVSNIEFIGDTEKLREIAENNWVKKYTLEFMQAKKSITYVIFYHVIEGNEMEAFEKTKLIEKIIHKKVKKANTVLKKIYDFCYSLEEGEVEIIKLNK